MFKMDGIELKFDHSAIEAVAKKAIELKTGARGLRTILEERMLDVMYSVHFEEDIKRITITEDFINKKEKDDLIEEMLLNRFNNDNTAV
jgi:ATP-dependent Clp protease ATP-binding subunit ClpX